jgi:hypothetical protein
MQGDRLDRVMVAGVDGVGGTQRRCRLQAPLVQVDGDQLGSALRERGEDDERTDAAGSKNHPGHTGRHAGPPYGVKRDRHWLGETRGVVGAGRGHRIAHASLLASRTDRLA